MWLFSINSNVFNCNVLLNTCGLPSLLFLQYSQKYCFLMKCSPFCTSYPQKQIKVNKMYYKEKISRQPCWRPKLPVEIKLKSLIATSLKYPFRKYRAVLEVHTYFKGLWRGVLFKICPTEFRVTSEMFLRDWKRVSKNTWRKVLVKIFVAR